MTSARTTAPAPGEAALPAASAAALLRRNAAQAQIAERPAVRFGAVTWTHADYVAECAHMAQLLLALRPEDGPFHVGVLLDNTPDYLVALGGAALVGATVVGLNHTRRGEHLLRDLTHADVGIVLSEPEHLADLAPIARDLPVAPERVLISRRWSEVDGDDAAAMLPGSRDLAEALAEVPSTDPGLEPSVDDRWALIFTSGTSSAPKAVICSQRRLLTTGARMATLLGIGADDVGYVCMPLFHSNAVMVGWAPSIVAGASVGLARRFTASGWLRDVRRYGATYFNYTGKPLSYVVAQPAAPDDADNPLRIAFGNEGSPEVVEAFARRFGVEVIDAFGATEGGIAVNRDVPMRSGAMGVAPPNICVVDDSGAPCPPARFDAHGRLANADDCVGEIVNTAGAGPFEGYWNNPEANERTLRNGWYWSGDLGYLDDDRYLYFAGRNADWIRVDGENFPAGPIADALARHPDVVVAVAYGVPDVHAGDQVMAAIVLRDGATFDGAAFAGWIDGLADLGPKWRPRFVRVARQLPTTGTNKVVVRTLVHQQVRRDRVGADAVWWRDRDAPSYVPFTPADEVARRDAMVAAGRERFWDL